MLILAQMSQEAPPLPSKEFCDTLKLGVKQPCHPPEEEAHGRQNYRDVLPV
jgi:hypothetical protein